MLKQIPSKVYHGLSFQKGCTPNLEQLASCFIEHGLLINNKGAEPQIKSVAEFVAMIQTNINSGNILAIEETELANTIQVFGKVAQITSEYQLTFTTPSATLVRYGINLFQLILQNNQWLISSMCWDDKNDKSMLTLSV